VISFCPACWLVCLSTLLIFSLAIDQATATKFLLGRCTVPGPYGKFNLVAMQVDCFCAGYIQQQQFIMLVQVD